MTQYDPKAFTRRQFLGTGLTMASASVAVPAFLQASAMGLPMPGLGMTSMPGVPEDHILVVVQLYRYFVADVPDDDRATSAGARGAISQIAQSMLASRYEIKPVLRKLFMSAHFYHGSVRNQQIKGPIQLVVGAIRSMLTPTRDLSVLIDALDLMGQNIFYPPSVKGWDGGRSWINTSTLYVRQNILNYLLTGRMPQGYDRSANTDRYDPQELMSALAEADPQAMQDPARVVEYLLRFTIGCAPTSARADLEAFVATNGGRMTDDMITGLLLLITAMPEYQLC